MDHHRKPSPDKILVEVPDDVKDLERDFQRMLYVENRLSVCSTLKHDRLNLKERFLQSLVPPDVQQGFSDQIMKLSKREKTLIDQITVLTSQVAQLKREQIIVKIERDTDANFDQRESDDIPQSPERHPSFLRKAVIAILIALVFYGIGRSHGKPCSPLSVDSDSVGVEHSILGGTTNGHYDQPKQGPSPSGKGNRRLP